MSSLDYYVGFEKEPTELDEFLKGIGFELTSSSHDDTRIYESIKDPIDIYYSPAVEEYDEDEEEGINWKESGRAITSDLLLTSKDYGLYETMQDISRKLLEKYDGVFHDPNMDDGFFGKGEL